MMSIYEITFITKDDNSQTVKKIIEDADGMIMLVKPLGRKKFTYPISRETAGFYTTVIFETEPSKIASIDKELRMDQTILRYITISYQKEFSSSEIEKKLRELSDPRQKEPAKPVDKKVEKVKEVKESLELTSDNKEVKKETTTPKEDKIKKTEEKSKAETLDKAQVEKVKRVEVKKEEVEKVINAKEASVQGEDIKEEKEEQKPKNEEEKPKVVLPKPKKEAVSEEERLAKLEEKLDELLKD